LYDALPHYYIKKVKEANKDPIKMYLKYLFQFALKIEEETINPSRGDEGNPRNSKESKTEISIARKPGGG
jgi:hypothetical protein